MVTLIRICSYDSVGKRQSYTWDELYKPSNQMDENCCSAEIAHVRHMLEGRNIILHVPNIVQGLFNYLNKVCFDEKLRSQDTTIVYEAIAYDNLDHAGAVWSYSSVDDQTLWASVRKCKVYINSLLNTTFDDLFTSLLHEMCHLAHYMLDEEIETEPHGHQWKEYARQCSQVFPYFQSVHMQHARLLKWDDVYAPQPAHIKFRYMNEMKVMKEKIAGRAMDMCDIAYTLYQYVNTHVYEGTLPNILIERTSMAPGDNRFDVGIFGYTCADATVPAAERIILMVLNQHTIIHFIHLFDTVLHEIAHVAQMHFHNDIGESHGAKWGEHVHKMLLVFPDFKPNENINDTWSSAYNTSSASAQTA